MATNQQIYEIVVKNNQALQSLTQVQQKVQKTSEVFDKLKGAISGLAIGAAIVNAVKFADTISDLSDATGIAIQNVLGFSKAIQSFGGNNEIAEKALLKVVTAIGTAAEGSAELQYAFGRVGVSLNDLATLSEQEILDKVVRGLGNVTDRGERAVLTQQLLGKEFRKVKNDGEDLANAIEASTEKQAKNAESVARAAEAFDKFEKAVSAVKTGILLAIEPITSFLAALDPKKIDEFGEAIGKLTIVLSGLWAYNKLIVFAEGLTAAATGAAAAFATWGLRLARFFGWVGLVIAGLQALNAIIKFAFDVDPMAKFGEWVGKAFNSVKEFFGVKPDESVKEELKDQSNAAKENAKANTEAGNAARQITDPFKALKEQIRGTADEFARLNKQNLESIKLSTEMIGKSREEQELRKADAEIAKKAADEIQKLEDQKAKLTKEQTAAGIGGEIDKQIAKIKEQAVTDSAATAAAIKNSQERIRGYDLEKFAKQSQIDVNNELKRIQDDIATSTMGTMARKEYEILAAARDRADVEIKAEEARRGSLLTDQEKLKFYELAKKGTDELVAKEKELYDQSRTFGFGWSKAFREYTENATNAANAASRIFQQATQGMEDMIVGFVKTGKLEWKSFVNSMLEELLRSQIRQVMSQVLSLGGGSGQSSGGSLLGSIGGLLGFANGGIIPTNQPVIVGERGPELLTGAAGRQVIPNSQLGSNQNVTYNISAVDAMSFKQMIAQDPSFIHAVALQGSRSIPGRR